MFSIESFLRIFVNIFAQSVACLFMFLAMSFKEKMVLTLVKSNLLFCFDS